MRTIYVNRAYLPEKSAQIPVMDRGFLFGDAIYEVTAMIDGRLIDNDLHLARLERSLKEMGIAQPCSCDELREIQHELARRNDMRDGTIYIQISRGTAERNFTFNADMEPNIVAFTQSKVLHGTAAQERGVSVDLIADPRWARRDIKTVQLLGQALAKQEAQSAGFDDVWMHQDGLITEGASNTAFIVTKDNVLLTRPNSHATLPGCTRRAVERLVAAQPDVQFEERAFTPQDAVAASEAFLTSASSFVTPVIRIADQVIGNGQPGPVTRSLQALYLQAARESREIVDFNKPAARVSA
ncbi:D-amino-acid transaminase [Thalassorhabdomicrobium marinisediminis]|uniref:Probable branched-chain-amino-acid aminotransferase n=1 Tax=Thalassorhabdomicrobium marinisediminis TaxID=2170577 RepID=A0A2T7FZ27_9RHOB|nr:D-amino-acid transaminase [Thalassorhabdomicrobium marinisediminis]PVA07427.1 D-amino acid aminotransferase [Thalassorhabdomicrobium marinisediminis]